GSLEKVNLPLKSPFQWGIAWLATASLLGIGFSRLQKRRQQLLEAAYNEDTEEQAEQPSPFRLWIGHATGELAKLSHGASIAPNQHIALSLEDAAHNILVLGGIGSGKTTRAMHPLLM